jgi:hypothetical protein
MLECRCSVSNSENIECPVQPFRVFVFSQPNIYNAFERLVTFLPKVIEHVLFYLCFHHSNSEPRV